MLSIKVFTIFIVCTACLNSVESQQLAKQIIHSYVSCYTDKDCKENSFCFGNDDDKIGKCKCLKGFELNRNITFYECLPVAKLGEACEKNYQCERIGSPLAYCNENKICECRPGTHEVEGVCYNSVKLGEICMVDPNCLLSDGTYAFCVSGRCICREEERESEDKTLCLGSRKFGEPCRSDQECISMPNSRCVEKCVCATDYTLSRNETQCVKAATKFGQPCEFDGQCSKFLVESVCNNGACGCMSGSHEYGNRCVVTKYIGQFCEKNEECVYRKEMNGNVNCDKERCVCLFGTKENGDCNIEKILDDGNSVSKLSVTFVSILGASIINLLYTFL